MIQTLWLTWPASRTSGTPRQGSATLAGGGAGSGGRMRSWLCTPSSPALAAAAFSMRCRKSRSATEFHPAFHHTHRDAGGKPLKLPYREAVHGRQLATTIQRASPKIGRNDPYPCGRAHRQPLRRLRRRPRGSERPVLPVRSHARAPAMTLAPSAANTLAVAWPMLELAPVKSVQSW